MGPRVVGWGPGLWGPGGSSDEALLLLRPELPAAPRPDGGLHGAVRCAGGSAATRGPPPPSQAALGGTLA